MPCPRRTTLALVHLVALASALSREALAQERPAPIPPPALSPQCIDDSMARDALACPRVTAAMALSAAPQRPPMAPRADRPASPRPTPALAAPDARANALRSRSTELVQREIQLLSQLLRTMRPTDSQHPATLLRLAETLEDHASSSNARGRELDEPIHQATASDPARARRLQAQQRAALDEARAARSQLVTVLERFVSLHGAHPRVDEALFSLAFTLQGLGHHERARQAYQQIITQFAQSRYVPNAHLAFAEHYFDLGAMDSAAPFYERVLALTTADDPLRGFALYKLAWTEFNRQQYDRSLQRFFDAIDHARAQSTPSAAALLRSARAELVTAYGAIYGATRPLSTSAALATFRRYAASPEDALATLERLAELYRDNGQWPNAVAVYHELQSQQPQSERLCLWQAEIAAAFVASNRRDDADRELVRLTDVLDRGRAPASTLSPQARVACRDRSARVLYDVASHLHIEALGGAGSTRPEGTRDPRTLARVASLYELLLSRFDDLDQVAFTDYDRRDWPTRYRVAYFRAEVLRAQSNLAECGPAYDRVVAMNPAGELAEDAAYKSVLCYNDLFSRDLALRARATPVETTARTLASRQYSPREQAMADAFTRYLCVAAPALRANANATATAGADEDPRQTLLTIQYRRAYLAYAANHLDEASAMLRAVALPASDDPARDARDPEGLRVIAADLHLDALASLARRVTPARPACFDAMERDLPALRGRYCEGAAAAEHSDFCGRIDLLGCQLARQKAESLGRAGRFRQSAEGLLSLLRDRPECRGRDDVRADEVLFNAAVMFDSANMLGHAMRVREALVSRFLAGGSAWAQRALYRLGGNYQAIQVFGRAADTYERYAEHVANNRASALRADPRAIEQSADALRQATLFRIGLGDEQKALEDASRFARYFAADPSLRRRAASVVFSIGQLYRDRAERAREDTARSPDARRALVRAAQTEVVRHYTAWVDRYAREGTLDQRVQGHVALGRAYAALGDVRSAQRYFRAAVESWGASGPESAQSAGEAQLRAQLAGEGEDALAEALEKSRDAATEARFGLAELEYQRFASQRTPAYRGPNSAAAFDRWVTQVLTPYVQQQQAHIATVAEPMFAEVIRSGIAHWQIAGAARLSDMYLQFAQTIRESPFPPDWNHPGEPYETLRLEWRIALDRRTEGLVESARAGYDGCVARATRARWFNEWSQRCERNLNDLDRRRYPLAEELRVPPSLVFSRPSNARFVFALEDSADLAGALSSR